MGLFGRPAFPHCFGVVSMAILANAQWSVNMPHQITALTGSCVVIPCRFSCPADHRPRDAVWYQYVNRGYPLVYSRNNPGKVIEKFRGKTELVGNVAEKNCSLKIEDVHATQNWEKLYVWIDPDETSFKFYDITVTLEVQVTVTPPEMSVAGEQREGRTIKVSCTAVHTCPPSPPFLSFGDQQGKVEVKHTEEGGGQWRVTAHISWMARAEDHGKKVECTVTHLQNKKATKTVVLNVAYAPVSVEVTGSQHTVLQGRNVLLSCKSNANPPVTAFRWYQINDGRVKLLRETNQNIDIINLDQADKQFQCMAINSLGSRNSSSKFEVFTQYKPSVLPGSHCSYHQGSLSCECLVRARPLASVEWMLGNDVQKSGLLQDTVNHNNHTTSFRWAATGTSDKVSVSCSVRNIHGKDKHILKIFLKAPPSNVSVSQNPAQPLEGQPVTLSCDSQSYPPATSYRWYRVEGGLVVQQEGEKQTFSLGNVARDDGRYSCSARNDLGETSSEITMVNVEYAPVILEESGCTVHNSWLKCECVVDSNPVASVSLTSLGLLRNKTLTRSSVLSGNMLKSVFSGSLENKVQEINCSATNKHGTKLHPLPVTESPVVPWMAVLGSVGGLLLCLGVVACCTRCKRQRTNAPNKTIDDFIQIREQMGTKQGDHPRAFPQPDAAVYEVDYENSSALEPQRQAALFDDNIYANW